LDKRKRQAKKNKKALFGTPLEAVVRTAGIESGSLHIPKLDAAFIDRGAYLPSGACFKSLSSFEETYRLRAFSESVALLHASSLLRLGHNLRIALVM
jgi:hypothetical protein